MQGDTIEEERRALRSLMNIRMPGELSEDVLQLQNEYLQERARGKGIVTLEDIPTVKEQYGSVTVITSHSASGY